MLLCRQEPPMPVDPFDSIHQSHHVGLSPELDATVDEVIAKTPPEGVGGYPVEHSSNGKPQKSRM